MRNRARSDGLVYSTRPLPAANRETREHKDGETGKLENGNQRTPTASFRVERKGRGGKKVTVVLMRGFPATAVAEHARRLRSMCGVGGTNKGESIELQGDLRERAREYFNAQGINIRG